MAPHHKIEIDGIKIRDLPPHCIPAAFEYKFLEKKVRLLISKVSVRFCSECSDCCCKKEICFESVESFWLKLMWKLAGNDLSSFDKSKGWLKNDGCLLKVGRPPVCYEFFCDKLKERIPKGPFVDLISKTLSLVGKNAINNSHLITLSSKQILLNLNFKKLRKRISQSYFLLRQKEKLLNDYF